MMNLLIIRWWLKCELCDKVLFVSGLLIYRNKYVVYIAVGLMVIRQFD